MSFTIEDMILTGEKKYEMKFLAGQNGWANSISWVHLLEDTTIIQNFWGKELAVTTGLGFPQRLDESGKEAEPVPCIRSDHQCGAVYQ